MSQAALVAHADGRAWSLARCIARRELTEIWSAQGDGEQAVVKLGREGREMDVALAHEARLLDRVQHPALVRCLARASVDGRPAIVLGWIEGPTLEEHLASGGLPVSEVLALGARIASALAALHEERIVHADVKPSNIVLGANGAVLIDLSIAIEEGDAWSEPWGSTAYVSPEQARGERPAAPSDVCSLGAVLFEALTGRHRFTGADEEVLDRIVRSDTPLPRIDGVPDGVAALLSSMLDRDPSRRPSARAASRTLEAWQSVRPTSERAQRGVSAPQRIEPLSILVGRDEELQRLRAAAASAHAGRSRLVLVTGRSGIGKSHLVSAFAHGLEPSVERLSIRLRQLDAEVPHRALALLVRRLGGPRAERMAAMLDPVETTRASREALRVALEEWAAERTQACPSVWIVEDSHWCDAASSNLFRSVLAASSRVLVVCTSREPIPVSMVDERIALEPLEARYAVQLADSVAPGAPIRPPDDGPDEAGSPLWICESAHEAMAGSSARSFAELVAHRRARLGSAASILVDAACVVGGIASLEALVHVGGLTDDADDALEEASDARLLARSTEGVAFRHERLREVLYVQLDPETRAGHHRAWALLQETDAQADPVNVASHFERGGALARARAHYVRAARSSRASPALAIELAMRALALDAVGIDAARANLVCAEAELALGSVERATLAAARAIEQTRPGAREWYRALSVALAASGDAMGRGRIEEWIAGLREAPFDASSASERVNALCYAYLAAVRLAQLDLANATLALASDLADVHVIDELARGRLHHARGRAASVRDPWEALVEVRQSRACFERAGDLESQLLAGHNEINMLIAIGALPEASASAERALADTKRMRGTLARARAVLIDAEVRLWRGDPTSVIALDQDREILDAAARSPRFSYVVGHVRSLAQLRAGDAAGALVTARRDLEIVLLPGSRAQAEACAARALARLGLVDEALAAAQRARELHASAGDAAEMDGLVVLLASAEAFLTAGDRESARATLREANAFVERQAATIGDPETRAQFPLRFPYAPDVRALEERLRG